MQCVTTPTLQVLWDGRFTKDFSSTNGIRQGDPISPYLFVLTVERLGHVITKSVESGRWKPIVLGKGGPSLSHLFFADDLVLFGEASLENAKTMQKVLEQFCLYSGHRVSAS